MSDAERFLREVSSAAWRGKSDHFIERRPQLQQLDRLVRQHDVVRLAVLGFTYRPEVYVAPAARNDFAGTAAR